MQERGLIEGVIFDVGGVLAYDIWEHLLPCRNKTGGIRDRFGLNKDEVHKIGKLLWGVFAHTPETPRANWRDLEKQYWRLFIDYFWPKDPPADASIDNFIQLTDKFIKLVSFEMPSLLGDLVARGIGLGVCSNNNEFWFRRQFSQLDLSPYFSPSKIVLSCRVGASKSSKVYEMFHATIDAMNIHPSRCIFIDDRPKNIERAIKVGLKGIHFETFTKLQSDLETALGG